MNFQNRDRRAMPLLAQFSLACFSWTRIWSAQRILNLNPCLLCVTNFKTLALAALHYLNAHHYIRVNGLAVGAMPRNPEDRGSIPHLGSRRSSLISIEHAELHCGLVGSAPTWNGTGCDQSSSIPGSFGYIYPMFIEPAILWVHIWLHTSVEIFFYRV